MRIAVFGRTGQVALELARMGGTCLGRDVADFADPDAVRRAAERVEADAIVNAVAYTAVDRAESEEVLARTVNATSVGALAEVAAARGLPLVHISTDYVFDGGGTAPWRPGDPVGPLGAYGRTKLEGERAVAAAGGVHAVLRTSWVFSAHGANFVKTMLRLGADRDRLRIVADQIGGPTPARGIAGACVTIAEALTRDPGLSGAYHYAGSPDVSWAGFARAIFADAGLQVAVEDIPSSDYPTPAARPKNSRLDCTATEAAFGIPRPDWRAALRETIAELRAG
ncbi:MAG: dTDP-4-dehydrorhamnose reductase [Rhodobacteraceae bacterium]|nr:dTDP-4-dehydrorhamnose reductase [Paracoccaceae bacterium]